jgi:hypothetical protein
MTKQTTIILILIVVLAVIAGYFYTQQPQVTTVEDQTGVTSTVQTATSTTTTPSTTRTSGSKGLPNFEWGFKLSEKNNITNTTISLTATYQNKSKVTKIISTVQGTCNLYDDRDANAYKASEMIMCYYAGFGRYYKVVQNGATYNVQRKEFEEASPDYNPPVQSFKTIVSF